MRRTYGDAELQALALRRRRDPEPLGPWARRYLGHYLTLPPSPFHEWLHRRLDRLRTERGTRLNILAPRGAAKSTWSTLAYPLYAALHGHEPYTVITSDSSDQAERFLSKIRYEVEDNPALLADYPHAAGRPLVSQQKCVVLRNGAMVEALGTGKKIRGRGNRQHRPSLVVIDDPQGPDHVVSANRRQCSWDWLTRDVMNAGTPATNVVVLGTALHPDGIVNRLQVTAGWESSVWRSVTRWPERMDLWRQWEEILHDWDRDDREAAALAYYRANREEMDR